MSVPFEHLKSAGVTDTGLKRRNNEDAILLLPEAGLFCVADGMGGTRGGEVASKATVDALEQTFREAPEAAQAVTAQAAARLAGRAINQASGWIRERADELGLSGTGSTVVVLLFDRVEPEVAVLLHAGDSRAYRYRGGRLEQLTHDHSVAAAAGVDDEDKLPAMFRGVITRAVGLEQAVELEETGVRVAAGDRYLICSDGLTKMVNDKNIGRILKRGGKQAVDEVAGELVGAALKAGGSDNVSVVLVEVGELRSYGVLEVSSSGVGDGPGEGLHEETRETREMEMALEEEEMETAVTGAGGGGSLGGVQRSDLTDSRGGARWWLWVLLLALVVAAVFVCIRYCEW